MYPFERFTDDAKRTLTLAQEEAERSHHSYIGTEHLLLGLTRNPSGSGYRVLTELGIRVDEVRRTIESVLGRNERTIIQQIIPTSRVKMVIEIAFEEARRMGHDEVNSGHLLMGLVIEGEGIAAHVLEDLGASAERVIAAVEGELGATPSGRGKQQKAKRPRFPFAGRMPFGPLATVISARYGMHSTPSDLETLHRLLRVPHIARLLQTKGTDVDALSKQLRQPPDAVVALRQELAALRHALRTAASAQHYEEAAMLQKKETVLVKKLEKAEQAWLDSLT